MPAKNPIAPVQGVRAPLSIKREPGIYTPALHPVVRMLVFITTVAAPEEHGPKGSWLAAALGPHPDTRAADRVVSDRLRFRSSPA